MCVGMIDRVVDRNPVFLVIRGKKKRRLNDGFCKIMYEIICRETKRESEILRKSLRLYCSKPQNLDIIIQEDKDD